MAGRTEKGGTQGRGEAADPARRDALRSLSGGVALAAALPALALGAAAPERGPLPIPTRPHAPARLDNTLPAFDPINDIKAGIDAGVSLIPGIGGVLRIFMDLFWPVGQPELTAILLQRVRSLVDDAIRAEVLENLADLLGHPAGAAGSGQPASGLNGAYGLYVGLVDDFRERPDASNRAAVAAQATALHTTFVTTAGQFMPQSQTFPDWRQQILPYFAQFANLHLVFLRDLLWHGPATGADGKPGYGFDDGGAGSTMDRFRGYFHDTRDQYVQYAAGQIAAIAVDLENGYQADRGKYADHGLDGAAGWQPSLIATGAWQAKLKQNVTNSQMIQLVRDYHDLWQAMDQPGGGQVRLTRELLFGPYGAPSLQDIGLKGDGSGPAPDVPAPPPPPATPLGYVAASTGALITRDGRDFNFPSAVTLFRRGDAIDLPPYNAYGISLDDRWGGPVVGVTVDLGAYDAWVSDDDYYDYSTSGYLVSRLQFTQQNGFVSSVGNGNTGWEVKSYASHAIDVPSGHELSSAFVPSTATALYGFLGKTPTALTYHSVGSITFGFRQIDPDLKPTTTLLKSLYVTTPLPLSLGDVHRQWLDAYRRKGAQVSVALAMRLLAEIESAAARQQWDRLRLAFQWQMRARRIG